MPDEEISRINIGYPLAQLFKAEASASPMAATRADQWRQVLSGLLSGSLKVGARTPVADAPPWVTLEIVTGGFATGNLAAGGPLQAHEVDKLKSIPRPAGASERAALNLYYISDQGAPELATMLETGRYRVSVPEEGALLVAVWLSKNGGRPIGGVAGNGDAVLRSPPLLSCPTRASNSIGERRPPSDSRRGSFVLAREATKEGGRCHERGDPGMDSSVRPSGGVDCRNG
jgi:hypothetical protein